MTQTITITPTFKITMHNHTPIDKKNQNSTQPMAPPTTTHQQKIKIKKNIPTPPTPSPEQKIKNKKPNPPHADQK
jgi:hypothetical protein